MDRMKRDVREAIVELCRWMHDRGLIAAKDGNVSVRTAPERLLVTPAGLPKGRLRPEDLVETDLAGHPIAPGPRSPTSELGMHLAVYRARSDVGAAVHAHPPVAVAHTVAGVSLEEPLLPEAWVELGGVETLDFTLPGTPAVAEAVERAVQGRNVLLLARHGALTVGPDLDTARNRLEVLEHTARISMYARSLAGGPVQPLPEEIRRALVPDSPKGC
jgi:L-fuculose-phosphate aldolase